MVQNRVIKTQIGKTVEDVLDFYLEAYAEDENLKATSTMFYNAKPLYSFFKNKKNSAVARFKSINNTFKFPISDIFDIVTKYQFFLLASLTGGRSFSSLG